MNVDEIFGGLPREMTTIERHNTMAKTPTRARMSRCRFDQKILFFFMTLLFFGDISKLDRPFPAPRQPFQNITRYTNIIPYRRSHDSFKLIAVFVANTNDPKSLCSNSAKLQ